MILEEESEPNEAKPFRMARDVYKSCMDVGKIQDLGLEPIKQILEDLGGWPVLIGRCQNPKIYDFFIRLSCLDTPYNIV